MNGLPADTCWSEGDPSAWPEEPPRPPPSLLEEPSCPRDEVSSFEAISNRERPLDFGAPPCPGDTEDLEPDALPWREGRIGDREPEL